MLFKYLLLSDNIKIFCAINSVNNCILLQSDIEHIEGVCTANLMNFSSSKTRVIAFVREINVVYCT